MAVRGLRDRISRRARRAGVSPPPEQLELLERYFALLARWNAKINLTAFKLSEPNDESLDRLLVEPLVACRYLPAGKLALIDIGSGGGSPALPLAICGGRMRLTLVEAKTRKAVFLVEATRALQLPDVKVESSRYEQLLTRPELHESFDILSIRAVRVETRALLTLQAFLRPGGRIFWFRGATGANVPSETSPPLVWEATHPLIESLRSRLVILRKER